MLCHAAGTSSSLSLTGPPVGHDTTSASVPAGPDVLEDDDVSGGSDSRDVEDWLKGEVLDEYKGTDGSSTAGVGREGSRRGATEGSSTCGFEFEESSSSRDSSASNSLP